MLRILKLLNRNLISDFENSKYLIQLRGLKITKIIELDETVNVQVSEVAESKSDI